MQTSEQADTKPPRNRPRTSTACTACRTKRRKCDGDPHQCSACRARNLACDYAPATDRRKPPSRAYVQALEARVRSLERQLVAAVARAEAAERLNNSHGGGHDGGVDGEDGDAKVPLAPAIAPSIDHVTDTLGSFNIGDGGEVCYFGARSNLNLLRRGGASGVPVLEAQRRGQDAVRRQVGMVDVSPERETRLLELFWTWQNAWLRVVVREPFERERKARGGNDACGRFCSPALLLAMLALGAHYDSDSELESTKEEEPGEAFASRAKIMLLHESEAPSPTTVQALALISVRETALDREGLGGMYCGMSVRMALSLGLHLDCGRCVSEGLLSAEQAEVRCVVWWGCYMLDKQLNIGLGRPSGVLDCLVTVKWPDEACEEERGIWGGEREEGMVARGVSCSIYACRMLLEVVEILDNIYSPNKPDKPGMATDAHLRLTAFYNALPAPLRVPRAATTRALPHVYQLHLQYHVLLILLHRPFIKSHRPLPTTITTTSATAPSPPRLAIDRTNMHFTHCRAAADAITSLLRAYKLHYGLARCPASAVHVAFSAAVVLLLDAVSAPPPSETMSGLKLSHPSAEERARRGLAVCVSALGEMGGTWRWGGRAERALRNLARGWSVFVSESNEGTEGGKERGDGVSDCGEIGIGEVGVLDQEPLLFGLGEEPELLLDAPGASLAEALDWSWLDPFAGEEIGEGFGEFGTFGTFGE